MVVVKGMQKRAGKVGMPVSYMLPFRQWWL